MSLVGTFMGLKTALPDDDFLTRFFESTDRVCSRCWVFFAILGAVAAVLVALELLGIADIDAPLDRLVLFSAIRLEVFQIVLVLVATFFVAFAYARLVLWATKPLR